MKKEDFLKELEEVIKTSKYERTVLTENRNSMSHAQLELSKTIISVNKNIVSAVGVAKSLLDSSK